MLKLSRKKGERLVIGKDREQIILEHFGYSSKADGSIEIMLGITASLHVEISTSPGISSRPMQQHDSGDRRQGKKLLISRYVGDRLQTGKNVSVTLSETSGGKVSFAIETARHISILREELLT